MRIIASVQAKRGSSRGLVHYIAHSKLDVEREAEKGRELFNSYADSLSVESANNSIKVGVSNARPSNDELHHLVLSFRPEDYGKLGRDEKARRRALKEVTRAAMSRLERVLAADRLFWTGAVHLNTGNPHVHIAIQKQFFTRAIEKEFLAKIPREALPHYEAREGEKVLVPGRLIDTAVERMEQLIDRERDITKNHEPKESSHRPDAKVERDSTYERDVLRQAFLAESELHRIDAKIKELTENGHKMRFVVSDPESGRRKRLSLSDLGHRKANSESDPKSPAETQIRTILFKMLAKEETAKAGYQIETAAVIREASRLKERYRKNDWKLPTPSLTKDEIDKLQDHYIQASDLRKFSYLESVRAELERSGEIQPRDRNAFGRIAAMKSISDLRARAHQKNHSDFADKRYYRHVEVGDRRLSLAQLDSTETAARNPILSFVEMLKDAASRLSGTGRESNIKTENDKLRNEIGERLDEQLEALNRDRKAELKKSKILEKIDKGRIKSGPVFSAPQLAEIETLALRLKLLPEYEKNWAQQQLLIRSAGSNCDAYRKQQKADPSADFAKFKTSVIAGRALAKETMAKLELEKVKEDLKIFTESKRFQKFAIEDKKTGALEFVSLHDADLPNRRSLLDRAVDELLEGREHRRLRRTVSSLVNDREIRLKEHVEAARDIAESAARHAAEFKEIALLGLRVEARHHPIFTSSEIASIETRITSTHDPKEAARLRTVLESATDGPGRSLAKMLRDFENPEMALARGKETGVAPQKTSGDGRTAGARENEQDGRAPELPQSHDHQLPDLVR